MRAERGRAGQVIVLACFLLPVLFCVAAIAIDVGSLCNSRSRLQSAADAASLAAVLELWERRVAGADEQGARTCAAAEAEAIKDANYPDSRAEIEFGLWDGATFTPCDTSKSANAARVRTSRGADAPGGPDGTPFARIFGLNGVSQARDAVARFWTAGGLMPVAIWQGDLVPAGQYLVVYDSQKITPGVFGLLDFDGGSNSTADLVEWFENGYPGQVWLAPDPGYMLIEGNPGFVAALNTPVDDLIATDAVVIACVYDAVWGTGANTVFRIVGFVALTVTERGTTDVDGHPTKYIQGRVQGYYLPATGETSGTMRQFMALQLVR